LKVTKYTFNKWLSDQINVSALLWSLQDLTVIYFKCTMDFQTLLFKYLLTLT